MQVADLRLPLAHVGCQLRAQRLRFLRQACLLGTTYYISKGLVSKVAAESPKLSVELLCLLLSLLLSLNLNSQLLLLKHGSLVGRLRRFNGSLLRLDLEPGLLPETRLLLLALLHGLAVQRGVALLLLLHQLLQTLHFLLLLRGEVGYVLLVAGKLSLPLGRDCIEL